MPAVVDDENGYSPLVSSVICDFIFSAFITYSMHVCGEQLIDFHGIAKS